MRFSLQNFYFFFLINWLSEKKKKTINEKIIFQNAKNFAKCNNFDFRCSIQLYIEISVIKYI